MINVDGQPRHPGSVPRDPAFASLGLSLAFAARAARAAWQHDFRPVQRNLAPDRVTIVRDPLHLFSTSRPKVRHA